MPLEKQLPGHHFVEYLNHRAVERSRSESVDGVDDSGSIASINGYWMQVQYAMALSALLHRRIFIRDAHAASGVRVMGSFHVREVHPHISPEKGLFSLVIAVELVGAEEIPVSVRLDTYIMYCK